MQGYILILAVLVLGGVIATVGDRIGMRVGKARLTLFNLRPRQTATVVSIMTGGVISASTLALMIGVSDQLQTGLFELESIQEDLENARFALAQTQQEVTEIESALQSATQEQTKAEERLSQINQSLQQAVERQESTEAQLRRTQNQLGAVSQQAQKLRSEIQRLQSERKTLLEQQATVQAQIAQRDQEIAERDQAIAERQERLDRLEVQRASLSQKVNRLTEDVDRLTEESQDIRTGFVTLRRNQVLAIGVSTVTGLEAATQVVEQLFREANRVALQSTLLGSIAVDEQILRIKTVEVEQVINRISNGQEYVLRILSTANYVAGEPCVVEGQEPCIDVRLDAEVNRVIFQPGEIIATTPVETTQLANRQLVERLNLLIASTQVKARQDGVINVDTVQISDGQRATLFRFLQQVQAYGRKLDLLAIASQPIFTIGPIRIDLVAIKNNEVLFQTTPSPSTR
ncbi:MAG: DUF3084 domain-containing protein [Leptolyngbyaceae cyanobacterium MO_188.B28]|nr:DUF3084 domain-containing protein [Leptolyngbyaceae cyanobacterium MO_188.B28]